MPPQGFFQRLNLHCNFNFSSHCNRSGFYIGLLLTGMCCAPARCSAVDALPKSAPVVVEDARVNLRLGKTLELPLPEHSTVEITGSRDIVEVTSSAGILILKPRKTGMIVLTVRAPQGVTQIYRVRVIDPTPATTTSLVESAPELAIVSVAETGQTLNGAHSTSTLPAAVAPLPSTTVPASVHVTTTSTELPARGTYRITGQANRMSVFAVAVDAQELFTALGDKANLRIIIDDLVSRRVTVNILNKPARQIVDDIASAYGLAVADVNGMTMISEGIPRSPSSYLLSDIDSIRTQYVDAANARNLLPVFLQDYVKVNSEQNSVVLSAPAEVLHKFREDIAQFDIPASQILVDLLLVELTDATIDQLGLSVAYTNAGRGLAIDSGAGTIGYRSLITLPQQFLASLRALREKGKARVRANPRIATVSGRRASIFVGRQRYVVTPIDSSQGQRNFIDAGVRLDITPYTGGQRQVLVDIDTEVSTLSAPDPITRLPEKSTRTASTVVRVNDGQTLIIGGLKQQESRDVRTKIPLLGDIPLLGQLFRTKDVRTVESELILFITPRILSDTGHLPEAEERMLKERFLQSNLSRPLPPAAPAHNGILPLPGGNKAGASGAAPQP